LPTLPSLLHVDSLGADLDEEAKDLALDRLSDLRPAVDPVVAHLTWALDAHLRLGGMRGRLFEEALLKALRASLAYSGGTAPPTARHSALSQRTLRKVREFIHDHLAQEFGIGDIARAACLSPHHLGRGFHEATGQSLWQYVLESRAALARTLIAAQPDVTLADIAGRTGFDSYGQFIAAFRKAYGITPGQHRRLLDQPKH
jgi:AraC family transcriptional regulator